MTIRFSSLMDYNESEIEFFDANEAFDISSNESRNALDLNGFLKYKNQILPNSDDIEYTILRNNLLNEMATVKTDHHYMENGPMSIISIHSSKRNEETSLDPRKTFIKNLDTGQHVSLFEVEGELKTKPSLKGKQTVNESVPVNGEDHTKRHQIATIANKRGKLDKFLNTLKRKLSIYSKLDKDERLSNEKHVLHHESIAGVSKNHHEDQSTYHHQDSKHVFKDTSSTASQSSHLSSKSTTSSKDKSQFYLKSVFSTRHHKMNHKNLTPVNARKKDEIELKSLTYVQDLRNHLEDISPSASFSSSLKKTRDKEMRIPGISAVWTIKFSYDGLKLAVGYKNGQLLLWKVVETLCTDLEKNGETTKSVSESSKGIVFTAFENEPFICYQAHKEDILEISWSKNDFILTCSADKTVCLWHYSKENSLLSFEHPDFVTSVSFHPSDDRFFITGCFDGYIRLWSIQEKTCCVSRFIPDVLITSVAFASQGRIVMAGSYSGKAYFYETEGLKYNTQFQVKNTSGGKIKKITGIESLPGSINEKILITSSDGKVRIYNMRDKSLYAHYKGVKNSNSLIRAKSSEDGSFIICGSENHKIYIWDNVLEENHFECFPNLSNTELSVDASPPAVNQGNDHPPKGEQKKVDKGISAFGFELPHIHNPIKMKKMQQLLSAAFRRDRPNRCEYFNAHEDKVTVALFAPNGTIKHIRDLLSDVGWYSSDSTVEGTADDMIIISADIQGRIKVFINRRALPGYGGTTCLPYTPDTEVYGEQTTTEA